MLPAAKPPASNRFQTAQPYPIVAERGMRRDNGGGNIRRIRPIRRGGRLKLPGVAEILLVKRIFVAKNGRCKAKSAARLNTLRAFLTQQMPFFSQKLRHNAESPQPLRYCQSTHHRAPAPSSPCRAANKPCSAECPPNKEAAKPLPPPTACRLPVFGIPPRSRSDRQKRLSITTR